MVFQTNRSIATSKTWLRILSFLLISLSFLIFGQQLIDHRIQKTQLDVFDEGAHLDYVLKLNDLHVPRLGEELGQETLRAIDCLGTIMKSADVCGNRLRDPGMYPASGFSYQAQQPPFGYIPIALFVDRGLDPKELIVKLRESQVFWFVLALLLALLIAIKQNFSNLQFATFASIALLTPVFINSLGTVTNEAAGPALGGLFLYLVAIQPLNRHKRAILVLLGISIGFTKLLFILLPLSAYIFYYVIEKRIDSSNQISRKKKSFLSASLHKKSFDSLIVLTSSVAAGVIFYGVQFVRKEPDANRVLESLLGFSKTSRPSVSTILQGINQGFQIANSYLPSIWFTSLSLLSIGIISFSLSKSGKNEFDFSGIYILGVFLTAFIWHIGSYLSGQYNFSAPTRYMLPFLFFFAFTIAHARKSVQWTVVFLTISGNFVWLMNPI